MHIILTGKASGWYQSFFSQEEYGNDGENIYLPKKEGLELHLDLYDGFVGSKVFLFYFCGNFFILVSFISLQ